MPLRLICILPVFLLLPLPLASQPIQMNRERLRIVLEAEGGAPLKVVK